MADAKKVRSQAKSYLTRAANSITKYLEEQVDDLSVEKCDLLINEFNDKLKLFDEAQRDFELTLDEDLMTAEIDAVSEYRIKQTDVLVRLREKMNLVKSKPVPPMQEASFTIPVSSNPKTVNLPKLQLPHFNGDILEFQSFWDKFLSLIDNRADLCDVNKFSYLQSLLRGEAKSCLQGLALTDANYETAKEIMLRRFGRKEKIIVAHIQKLLNISTKETLWEIYDQVQVNVRSLSNLGVTGDNYGLVLTPMILHRLPPSVRLEWARSSEGKEGDVENLLSFLFEEIQRRERSTQLERGDSSSTERFKNLRKPHRPTGAALFTPNNGSSKRRSCAFCGLDHFSDKCSTITSLTHDQRKEKIKTMCLCFKCLSKDHRARQCNKVCYFCKGPHHSVLHLNKWDGANAPVVSESSNDRGNSNSNGGTFSGLSCSGDGNGGNTVVNNASPPSHISAVTGEFHYSNSSATGKATLMQVVKTNIEKQPVTVLFDSGSDFSYIKQETAQKLRLERKGETVGNISAFGGELVKQKHNIFELQLGGIRTTLLSLKTIASPLYRAPVPTDILKTFQNIPCDEELTHEGIISVDILIGLDFYHEFMYSESQKSNGLVAQSTRLGWMISGSYPMSGNQLGSKSKQTSLLSSSHQPSEATIRKFWELSSIGILGEGQPESDSQIFEKFSEGVSFKGDRYQVGLPWKDEKMKDKLMNNESSSKKRLVALEKKLALDSDLKGKYQEVFQDLENKGIIEEITATDPSFSQHPLFYLPHRPVIRDESQTTKIRPVFDASAKGENGVFLNDCVEVGPKMTPDLVKILLRFRRWRYGLSADIQKAFLQIELQEVDRDVHRFLLFDDRNQVRHMRFKRVTFGVASSPFMLNATIKIHLDKFEKDRTIQELEKNLYVDDWLTGSDSENELSEMVSRSTEVLQQGGFPLTKWISNSPKVREDLRRSFDYYDDSQSQKLLGLAWNPASDCFHFETNHKVSEIFTKRSLLGLVARQFDPLGLLTPFTISLKILFQEVWKTGFEWDDTLPSDFQDEINIWIAGLREINSWRISRRLSKLDWHEMQDKELIVFVDASEKAYGACIYLASKDDYGTQLRHVMSRAKVAPLKRVTLPRLELLAALLGARLLKFVREALELPENTPYKCWTDSSITLAWIRGESSRWKQFVRNRVEEIQCLTNPSNWKHCPGKENPADLLTRGVKAGILTGSTLWLEGPEMLVENNETILDHQVLLSAGIEVKEFEETKAEVCSLASETRNVIDYERFSSFGKIVRVVTLVHEFVGKLKAARSQTPVSSMGEELIRAKLWIIKDLQNRHYSSEIADLQKHGKVSRHSSLLPLSPLLDSDGLIRIQGRLEQATSLTYDEKHPVILPRCHVSLLLVKSQHELLKHAGVSTLISSLRCQYWIIGARGMAKRVVRQCIQCRRHDSRPLDQVRAPLPHDRVTRAPPFSVTGIDCAGPLYCSDTGENKYYIVLFTCAVTRALHLELVNSLSLNDFILAFRRFVSRRAFPSIIYSDNARTFKAASATLQARFGKEIVCWKNICPLSPNWGGWWERLVRSVKSALKKSLGRQSVTKVELGTLIPEIEACVNSRPLIYTSEMGHVLTPSHFLIGRGTPLTSVELENLEKVVSLPDRYEFEEALTEQFWQVWKNEYLRNLPPVTANHHKTDNCLEVGSMVLIKDEKRPRMLWALGRVVKLYKGIDGKVRAVQLRTQKGILVRSIQHLCLMEDRSGDPIDSDISDPQKCPQSSVTHETETDDLTAGLPMTIETSVTEDPALVEPPNEKDLNSGKSKFGRTIKPTKKLDL